MVIELNQVWPCMTHHPLFWSDQPTISLILPFLRDLIKNPEICIKLDVMVVSQKQTFSGVWYTSLNNVCIKLEGIMDWIGLSSNSAPTMYQTWTLYQIRRYYTIIIMDRVVLIKQTSHISNKAPKGFGLPIGCYNSLNNITALNQHQTFQSHDNIFCFFSFSTLLILFWWENVGLTLNYKQ